MEKMGVILMQKYELGRLLGQGTFAKVYHARRLSTGQSVAIKIIDKEKILKVKLINQIKREISVMRRVRHPNIVELYEVMASRTRIYFVMEYVKGGELFDKVSIGRLGEDEARRYFQQMIGAVDFCHSRGVYHRDIKPENLLLDDNGNLKITDFGLSTLPESRRKDGLLQTTCGTPAYVAPEVINNLKGYDGSKADIWSCGVVLYVLLAGFLPFHDDNLMDMYRKISRGDFKCPNWFPAEARKLLSKILDPCLKSRITMGQVMENSWFGKGFVKRSVNHHENSSRHYQVHEDHDASSPTTPRDVRDAFSLYLEESSRSSCTNLDKIGEEDESQESCCAEKMKLTHMNAFDIISMSPGFDLSGLFENNTEELSSSSTSIPRGEATRFATDKTASAIVSRLEELAESEKFAVKKKGGKVMLQSNTEGRKGLLAIDAEIFEIAPCLHMVEVSKASGDTWEYVKFCERDLRPALKDVTWTWEGENHS